MRERLGTQVKIREGKPITLLNASEPEPDIAVVKPLGNVYKTQRHPQGADIFWVIEYSNTSLEKDLHLKSQIYAREGIPEYWVINLKTRELIVFRDPAGGDYQSQQTMTNGVIYPVCFPDVEIAIASLLS